MTRILVASVILLQASVVWSEPTFIEEAQKLIGDLAAANPGEQVTILDELWVSREERLSECGDSECEELTPEEKGVLADQLLPEVLLVASSNDHLVRNRALLLISHLLDCCLGEFTQEVPRVRAAVLEAASEVDPLFYASTATAIRVLYKYFSPSVSLTREFLTRSLHADMNLEVARYIFFSALAQAVNSPDLISDIERALRGADAIRKRTLLMCIGSLLRDDHHQRLREQLEDEVLDCLAHDDPHVQSEALATLREFAKNANPSDRSIETVIATALNHDRDVQVRWDAISCLRTFSHQRDNKWIHEALVLLAHDAANSDNIRIEAIRAYAYVQRDRVERDSFIKGFETEANPRIAEAISGYFHNKTLEESGATTTNP